MLALAVTAASELPVALSLATKKQKSFRVLTKLNIFSLDNRVCTVIQLHLAQKNFRTRDADYLKYSWQFIKFTPLCVTRVEIIKMQRSKKINKIF